MIFSSSGSSALVTASTEPGAIEEPTTAESCEIVPVWWARSSFSSFIDSITARDGGGGHRRLFWDRSTIWR